MGDKLCFDQMKKWGIGPSAKTNMGIRFFVTRLGGVPLIGLRPTNQNIIVEGFLATRMPTLNGCWELL